MSLRLVFPLRSCTRHMVYQSAENVNRHSTLVLQLLSVKNPNCGISPGDHKSQGF